MSTKSEEKYSVDLKTSKTIMPGSLAIKTSVKTQEQTLTLSLSSPLSNLLPGDEFLIKIKH